MARLVLLNLRQSAPVVLAWGALLFIAAVVIGGYHRPTPLSLEKAPPGKRG
jgi:hypothetical protein